MVEVRLHGDLAKQFGARWDLEIHSPREAVAAIEANRPGFRNAIMRLDSAGYCFRVRSLEHDYAEADLAVSLGSVSRIDIIPIVTGSSAGVRFVVGAMLIAASFAFGGPLAGLPQMLAFNVGMSLVLGSVAQWLTPIQKADDPSRKLGSWTFSGPSNEVSQGQCVPVAYGEVLIGGIPISGGLSSSDIAANGSTDPDVAIGGQFDVSHSAPNETVLTTVLVFSAGSFNLTDPFTYAWSYTGFAGATSVTKTGDGTATVRFTVVATLSAEQRVAFTGTVSVTVTGKDATGATTDTKTVSASEPVTLTVDNLPFERITQ